MEWVALAGILLSALAKFYAREPGNFSRKGEAGLFLA